MALVMPWLVACSAMSPGMHFDSPSDAGPATSVVGPFAFDAKPIMKTITAELVKEEKEQRRSQVSQDISHLLGGPAPYSIQAGDILSIVVWDHPELAGAVNNVAQTTETNENHGSGAPAAGFVVDHAGVIQFPYAGALKVAGMTEAQARNALAAKLARYIRQPDVTLRVQAYRSKRVYVDGEVKSPGQQPITDIPMTLMEALNRAGGVLPTADQSDITITRAEKSYKVDLLQMMQKGANPSSIMLANGDVVRVGSRDDSKIFVTGEVVQPRAMQMRNGRMTLNEALGEAGGINPQTGDGRQVYVVRNATAKEPIVYHLNARTPAGLAVAQEFELRPQDVVYVDAAPLATWHRVVSLIFPSALTQVVQTGASYQTPR
ncbi:MAG TPA: polysaccharide biosynthesis/export family protein [Burkholderiaceae bacterium]|nr:polysaccharide biosynthesis/export family protein [Burkholderiaceae bacterium]